ncbi:homoserine acetyltransferase, partial [Staphylococcus aureus]|nr:homoserine acetyltransferase [Staphylococcus aureus]
MTKYTVDTLNLGKIITESGEVIDNLRFRYEHVGYHGQPLVVVSQALTGNHLTYGTDYYTG